MISFETLETLARAQGLDAVSVLPAGLAPSRERLWQWVEAGYAGDMTWMVRTALLRVDPFRLLPGVRSLVVVMMRYASRPQTPPPGSGRIARYAWGREYHRVLRKRLWRLWREILAQTGRADAKARVFVDAGPLWERDFAAAAGLGWRAKNTHVIHPRLGSYTFLGVLLTTLALPEPPIPPMLRALYGSRAEGRSAPFSLCGSCRRCLEACPTQAFVAPGVLDARACISYLTIEYRGPIPLSFRTQMGTWLVGCDVCQEVCPWNGQLLSLPSSHPFAGTRDAGWVSLHEAVQMDEESFHHRFQGRAVRRLSPEQFRRNAAVVLGNVGTPRDLPFLARRLREEPSPLVREHLRWAIQVIRGRIRRSS
ncbi:MAG: tRNA epoxyqueuosine(34) reductase QueG [Candidatus Hydrothermae bacterium]|nr:tRNA epoxyqueuosine(34) reductase QueG [Candidatus Hydrothermae bacterium]